MVFRCVLYGAVLALAVAAFFWAQSTGEPSFVAVSVEKEQSPSSATGILVAAQGGAQDQAHVREMASEGADVSGTVVVAAEYDDKAVASDLGVTLHRFGGDCNVGILRGITDQEGRFVFHGVTPGDYVVSTAIATLEHTSAERVLVRSAETKRVSLVIAAPYRIRGHVLCDGRPVEGAEVWLAQSGLSSAQPAMVAVSDVRGVFETRTGYPAVCMQARAALFAPSPLEFVKTMTGEVAEVELVLAGTGGSLQGSVLGSEGAPVAGAVVRVGGGILDSIDVDRGERVVPMEVTTAASGEFRFVGVACGPQEITVRAAHLAPWKGECRIVAGQETRLDVHLTLGGRVFGKVVLQDGTDVPGALVEYGERGSLLHYQQLAGADGEYDIDGLPDGELRMRARTRTKGMGESRVSVSPGESVLVDITLTNGTSIEGVLRTSRSQAVAEAHIEAYTTDGEGKASWFQHAATDRNGSFTLRNVPDGTIDICATKMSIYDVQVKGVDAHVGAINLVATEREPASAWVVGRLVGDAARQGVALVELRSEDLRVIVGSQKVATGDGGIRFGPIPPGTYSVQMSCGDYPKITRRAYVKPNGTWDLGDVAVKRGGRIKVVPDGAWPRECWFGVLNEEHSWVTTFHGDESGALSDEIECGNYYVTTLGDDVARAMLKVAVGDGVAELKLRMQKGVKVKVVAEDAGPGVRFVLRIRRGDAIVVQSECLGRSGGLALAYCLLPGSYHVDVLRDHSVSGYDMELGEKDGVQVWRVSGN